MPNKRITTKDKWDYHAEGFFRAVFLVVFFWLIVLGVPYLIAEFIGA